MERGVNGMASSPPESVVDGAERAAGGRFAPLSPDDPKPGETWRHYKGQDYEIIAVGLDWYSPTPMVAYRSPKTGRTWFRTLANFTEVYTTPGVGGHPVPYRRFSRIGRPKDDDGPDSVPGSGVAELARRCREAESEAYGNVDRLAQISTICRGVAGVDAGSAIESVRVVAERARKWAESAKAIGEATTAYPPGSIDEQRCREETEQQYKSMGAALAEIRAICRAEGIDFGTTVESVRMLATRARLYIEMTDRVNRGRDDCQPGKPPGTMTREEFEAVRFGIENAAPMGDPTIDDGDVSQDGKPDPLESMQEVWVALQQVIARLDVMLDLCDEDRYAMALGKVLADADRARDHLDAAMGEVEDAAGIGPGEPD